MLGFLFLAMLLIGFLHWGNVALVISRYTVESSRLPEAFRGYTVAAISDLHNASFGKDQQRLIARLEKADPDLIVITGDLVDSRRTDLLPALCLVEKAVSIAPVYYVTGNHESRISEFAQLEEGLHKAGARVLHGEGVTLSRGGADILLLGIDDPAFSGLYPESALQGIPRNEEMFTILLSHRPECFSQYAGAGIDLTFSGHAHGGQVRVPGVGGLYAPHQGFMPEYTQGLYTMGDAAMVVSRGLGNSLFPLRLNNPPELVLVTLEKPGLFTEREENK